METTADFLKWIRSILGDEHWSYCVSEKLDLWKCNHSSRTSREVAYQVWVSCKLLREPWHWISSEAPSLAALKRFCEAELWAAIRTEWARQNGPRSAVLRPDVIDAKVPRLAKKPAALEDKTAPQPRAPLPGQKRLALTYQPMDVELYIPGKH